MTLSDKVFVGVVAAVGAMYLNNPGQVAELWNQVVASPHVEEAKAIVLQAKLAVDKALKGMEPTFVILLSFIVFYLLQWFLTPVAEFLFGEGHLGEKLKTGFFKTVRQLPFVGGAIKKEVAKNLKGIEKDVVVPLQNGLEVYRTLPEKGMSADEVLERMAELKKMGDFDKRFNEGKVSGTIYVPSQDHKAYNVILCKAYSMFTWTNPLHMGIFPGVREMEAELIRFGCDIFNGGPDSCGSMTSGGTESIVMACKAYRDFAREHRGITRPNAVLPRTVHPAFEKGCQYMGIAVRKVTENSKTCKVSASDMEDAMDENTVFIVGSCPQYPHGAVDPIEDLAKLALKFGCGLHVDCCLGSFVVPFIREVDPTFPKFDFSVRGVTSISADTHKYGYAPKGSSLIMYSNTQLHQSQFSVFPDWPGGIYGTPSLAGSRPGALVAATYCAMMMQGKQGYRTRAHQIIKIAKEVAEGIKKIRGLRLMCEPQSSVVAWTSDVFNVNLMVDGMIKERHWDLNVLQFPAAVHICITMAHTRPGFVQDFLRDLTAATAKLVADPNQKLSEKAAVYGTSQAIPDRSIIGDIVRGYISITYKLPGEEAATADEGAQAKATAVSPKKDKKGKKGTN